MKRPDGPAPLCECGCGEEVNWNHNGSWSRWRPHHHGRRLKTPVKTTPRSVPTSSGKQLKLWEDEP